VVLVVETSSPAKPEELPSLQELAGRNYVSLDQAAKLIGVSYQTALKYVKSGKLKAVRVGGGWRIYEDSLKAFLTGQS
jgi:excisionase family DNA binding protein